MKAKLDYWLKKLTSKEYLEKILEYAITHLQLNLIISNLNLKFYEDLLANIIDEADEYIEEKLADYLEEDINKLL